MLAPLAALGVLQLVLARRKGQGPGAGAGLVMAWAGANLAFYGLASPTVWAHNVLEFLPAVAVLAGLGAARLVPARGASARDLAWTTAGGAFAIACLLGPTPLRNDNWDRDAVYGFGYVARSELRDLADLIRREVPPDGVVVAPAFLCFEANRRPLIRYPETAGVLADGQRRVARDGFAATRRALADADFFERIGRTSSAWMTELMTALREGRVDLLIPDSAHQLVAILGPPPAWLREAGLAPVARTEHFAVWQRADDATGPQRKTAAEARASAADRSSSQPELESR